MSDKVTPARQRWAVAAAGQEADTMKPAIILSLPLVWSVRNFICSGVTATLSRDFRIIFAVPPQGKQDLVEQGVRPSDIFTLETGPDTRLHSWIYRLVRRAHRWRHPTATDLLADQWRRRRSNMKHRLRDTLFDHVGKAAARRGLFRSLDAKERDLYLKTVPRNVWEFLDETKPVFALSTNCVTSWERPLFEALRTRRVPTATHISSFDNVTSRGYLAQLKLFDHYLVWQENMAAELKQFYQISAHQLAITGTPQFDFHVRPQFRWSRERTLAALNLDPRRPYFVYGANHDRVTPTEPEVVHHIVSEISRETPFRHHQWLVRPHPMDNYRRWDALGRRAPQVVLNVPWSHGERARFWATPTVEQLALLGNVLRHADAVMTMGSTLALDSAVVDTPVVCIGFHPDAGSFEAKAYHANHFQHHYRPIMASKAVPLAASIGELKRHLEAAIRDRDALRPERANLVRQLCGVMDGRAADRVSAAVRDMVTREGARPSGDVDPCGPSHAGAAHSGTPSAVRSGIPW